MRTSLTLLAILIILLPACNNGDPKPADNSSGDTVTNHTTDTSDSTAASAVTNLPASNTYNAADSVGEVIPPEESDTLKFCFIKRFYEENGNAYIDADYIQFFYGDKALAAAKKRKEEEVVQDDYYILNENSRVRKLALAPSVQCRTVTMGKSQMVLKASTLQELKARYNVESIYILLLDNSNTVKGIQEQYLP